MLNPKSKTLNSKQRLNYKYKFLIGAALFFLFLGGCQSQSSYRDNRILLGTYVEVISSDKAAADIVFNEIARIEALLSKYDPESEISRLNKNGILTASPETFYILSKAVEFYRLSAGAFDVTVAPLMDLWGFTEKKYRLPPDQEVRQARKYVGSENILLLAQNYMVKLGKSGVKIDLGAIAKGYALDCAADKLKQAGIKSCLVYAGGQIYALGDNSGRPWKIAIRAPSGRGISGYLKVKNKAVSTSGGYEQFFKVGDKLYAHIIDPRTGYPADSAIASVTVLAEDGLTADALSTAIYVLGREKGLKLAAKFPLAEVKITER